jgi:hypothetical protein
MNLFLAIAAVLAWLFGGMMLLIPEQFFAPTGLVMTKPVRLLPVSGQATSGLKASGLILTFASHLRRHLCEC